MTRERNLWGQEPMWQGKPKDPIRDVLRFFTGRAPPPYVHGYDYKHFSDKEHSDLQDWVSLSLGKSPLYWSTAIALIEAAERIVEEAVSNGNIPAKDSEWHKEGMARKFFEPRKKKKKKT